MPMSATGLKNILGRRDFLKLAAGGATAAFLSGCGNPSPPLDKKPNILLVLTDDQGWGDVSCHNNTFLDTPVMDRLAAEGARFSNFYVDPVCAPTRAALLTGRYAQRAGVTGVTAGKEQLNLDEVTLADDFSQAGYATGCFGKWHNGANYPYHPLGRGFEEFYGFCGGHTNMYFDPDLERNGNKVETSGYIADIITDSAIGFIESNRAEPFFCYVPYNTPHSPFQLPDSYYDKYRNLGLDEMTASVYGMIENLDYNLGRILDTLDRLGIADNTVVLFIGDNGPAFTRYNAGMKGEKGDPEEGGTKVPCFIRYPKAIQPASVVETASAHIDILPTLTALAGISHQGGLPLDGLNLTPLFSGDGNDISERLIFSTFYTRDRGSVRNKHYRLLLEPSHEPYLYDLRLDPTQRTEVADKYPGVAEYLESEYNRWHAEIGRRIPEQRTTPVGFTQWPSATLFAQDAQLDGCVKFHASGYSHDWITGWSDTSGKISWLVDVNQAGRYALELLYTCPEKDTGSTIIIEAGGRQLETVISRAFDPPTKPSPDRIPRRKTYERKDWAVHPAGELALEKGRCVLSVGASAIPGNSAPDLKEIRLTLL
jgi:arylsulfatase A-like enzyme